MYIYIYTYVYVYIYTYVYIKIMNILPWSQMGSLFTPKHSCPISLANDHFSWSQVVGLEVSWGQECFTSLGPVQLYVILHTLYYLVFYPFAIFFFILPTLGLHLCFSTETPNFEWTVKCWTWVQLCGTAMVKSGMGDPKVWCFFSSSLASSQNRNVAWRNPLIWAHMETFLKWGYPQSSSISRWDFPWTKRTSYWGPPFFNKPPHLETSLETSQTRQTQLIHITAKRRHAKKTSTSSWDQPIWEGALALEILVSQANMMINDETVFFFKHHIQHKRMMP